MRITDPATPLFNPDARKRPTNVTVNGDLLDKARELGINLSASLEGALTEELRRRRARQWLDENRGAIDAYNEDVSARGAFSDRLRGF
jgi:antitoxin CcdA